MMQMKQKMSMAVVILGVVGMAIFLNAPSASAQQSQPQEPAITPTATPVPVEVREVSVDEVNDVARGLYCPVCSNVPLDVCATQACADWREVIRQKLAEGWTAERIKLYFSQRYGDRVLPVPTNPLIYIIPGVIVLAGAVGVANLIRPKKKAPGAPAAAVELPADDPYIARLEAELQNASRGDPEIMSQSQPEAGNKKNTNWGAILAYGLVIVFLGLLAWRLVDANVTVQVGQKVPDFSLTTFDDQLINTQDLRGKVILVNVWASWCVPCENEAAFLEEAWQYYQPGGQVVFLGVNWQDIEPKADEYLQRFQVSYINGPDYSERIGRIFRVTGVPETYVIDQEGNLSFMLKGEFTSLEQITRVIDPLLQTP